MNALPLDRRSWLGVSFGPLVVTLCSVGLLLELDRPLGFSSPRGLELAVFVSLSLASGAIPGRWLLALHERQGVWPWLASLLSLAGAVAAAGAYHALIVALGAELEFTSLTAMFWKWAREPEGSMLVFVLLVAIVAPLDFVWLALQVLAARFAIYLGMILLPAAGLALGIGTYALARRRRVDM